MLQHPILKVACVNLITSWITAILYSFSQETDLLIKVIMKSVNIKLLDILGCFHYILNAPRINGFVGAASVNTDSQWSKQETCLARENQVWLVVNLNTSVTSGSQCSKRIAKASEFGSCQSYSCISRSYEQLQIKCLL